MAKRLQGAGHEKHLKGLASLAIVKELTTLNTAPKNMSSKEGSVKQDDVMDMDDDSQQEEIPISCEALASYHKKEQQCIKAKSSEQQMSNIAEFMPQSTSSKSSQKNRKLLNLNISQICAQKPKTDKKLKEWHKKHYIGKQQKRVNHRVSDKKANIEKKVKERGQRIQMTL